jgi:hypothetical protein
MELVAWIVNGIALALCKIRYIRMLLVCVCVCVCVCTCACVCISKLNYLCMVLHFHSVTE